MFVGGQEGHLVCKKMPRQKSPMVLIFGPGERDVAWSDLWRK